MTVIFKSAYRLKAHHEQDNEVFDMYNGHAGAVLF